MDKKRSKRTACHGVDGNGGEFAGFRAMNDAQIESTIRTRDWLIHLMRRSGQRVRQVAS